ncbi:MAG: endonuclease domain-containing protein [Gracilimonas sp.]
MSRNKIIPYNPELRSYARSLRNNSTFSEILLWQQIKKRKLGVQFHRQVPMDQFIVDFYCHEIMLAIEVDGRSHHNPKQAAKDVERQNILEGYGVQFIRIRDEEVKNNMDRVLRYLKSKVVSLLE